MRDFTGVVLEVKTVLMTEGQLMVLKLVNEKIKMDPNIVKLKMESFNKSC